MEAQERGGEQGDPMVMTHPDVWCMGEPYERYVGRWSRRVAPVFLTWLDVAARRRWLDVGCGTGALSGAILREADPASVIGVDPSAGFLAVARHGISEAHAQFLAGDAAAIPLALGAVDVVVSGLVLNFLTAPALALAEWHRVASSGATIAAYVWDYGDGMELMRTFWTAAIELDPAAARFDEGRRFRSLCTPAGLAELWERSGLREVETVAIEVPTVFADFDDYWTPFLGGQGVAPAYVAMLSPDAVGTLRERLRTIVPIAADGTIPMTARAWAVRGKAL
jgi:SAM-dependent methyltransferase